jgi:diaminopimelate decarboxylase
MAARPIRTRKNAASPAVPFQYRSGELFCEGVPLRRIAASVGTPCYLYSGSQILSRFREFDAALAPRPHLICYSVKASGNIHILRLLARQGSGFDIVSAGELYRVLQAGGKVSRVVFSGVGKTAEEMDYALRAGIRLFNCESESELHLLNQRALRLRKKAPVALRVNPHVNAETHPHIATGLRQHKFGIEISSAERLYQRAPQWPGLRFLGLSCHIGSQIGDLAPVEQAVSKLVALAETLQRAGFPVRYLDAGGGLGVPYNCADSFPSIQDYCRRIVRCLHGGPWTLLLEPGRALVADAAVLLTRVIHTKTTGRKKFVIVDAAMNDLIRPSLYGAFHDIRPVVASDGETIVADIVGPICESGDFFARGRSLPAVRPGDLLAIFTVGAYGFALSSNYNARPRPAEVLVQRNRWRLARRRETFRDLVRPELVS